jgi:hypothetical protein
MDKVIKEIREATAELKEFNDNHIPAHITMTVHALIEESHDKEDIDSIYDYLTKNYNLMQLSFQEILNIVSILERCEHCNEWNNTDDINDNAYYGKRVCPTCIRNV